MTIKHAKHARRAPPKHAEHATENPSTDQPQEDFPIYHLCGISECVDQLANILEQIREDIMPALNHRSLN